MAHDVFISYSHTDKPTADAACATLESRGIRCWIAPRDVLPGEEYASALVTAIHSSRLLVLVFSSGANQSPQVLREVERAVSKGLPILPLRIEDVAPSAAMEYYISSRHWLDALTTPLEQHLVQLADTVTLLLARATGGAIPAPPKEAVRPVPPVVVEEPTVAPPPTPQPLPKPQPQPQAPRADPASRPAEPSRPVKATTEPIRRRVAGAALIMLPALALGPFIQAGGQDSYGWTRSQSVSLSVLRLLVFVVALAVGGLWLRRAQPRRIATVAGLLYGVGLLLAGLMVPASPGATFAWSLLTLACLASAGAGLGSIVALTSLLRWFPDRRGQVAGLATATFSIGVGAAIGLRWMFGVRLLVPVGIAALITVLLAARSLLNAPPGYLPVGWAPSPRQQRDRTGTPSVLRDAMGTRQFYLLWALLFVNTAASIVALLNFQASAGWVEFKAIALAASGIAGSMLWGWISDRAGTRKVLLMLLVAQGLLLLGTLALRSAGPGAQGWIMMVFTLCNGGAFALVPALVADYFGTDDIGAVLGVTLSAWSLALLAAPSVFIFGFMLAFLGDSQRYLLPAGALLAAALVTFLLRPPRAPVSSHSAT